MSKSNWIGNVELGVIISKENVTNEILSTFKNLQSEADKNSITYKIAGDKSSIESMLKQLQGLTPELLTKMTLNFDKSDFDKEMNRLKGFSEKSSSEIGQNFKENIESSLKNFNISEIIGRDLKKGNKLLPDEIGKINQALKSLTDKTSNFDLTKVTSVKEIEDQAIALGKIEKIYKDLSVVQKTITFNGVKFDIASELEKSTINVDSLMKNVGQVIHSNASQWATNLETTFNSEFNNIVALFNHLQEIINGTFQPGTGGSGGFGVNKALEDLSRQLDEVNAKIKDTEDELNKLKTESSKPAKTQDTTALFRQISSKSGKAKDDLVWEEHGGKNSSAVKEVASLIKEYMEAGGLLKDLGSNAKYIVKELGIEQIAPKAQEASNRIAELTSHLAAYRTEKENLLQQQQSLQAQSSSSVSKQDGTGVGSRGSGQAAGTHASATLSPTLSLDFKQKLQEQVTAIGSVEATVGGKLSETFKSDIQTSVDNAGKVNVGVTFSDTQKDGNKQEIPVNVTTTPKLSETFQSDLQQLVDNTGKYKIKIDADSNNQDGLVPIKVTVENGEEFKNQLKSAVEGEGGLNVKVNPIIDNDFKLEINNAVLKDVKVDGTISGGNLKPDTVDTSGAKDKNTVVEQKQQESVKNTQNIQKNNHSEESRQLSFLDSATDKTDKHTESIKKETDAMSKLSEKTKEAIERLDEYYKKDNSRASDAGRYGIKSNINSYMNTIKSDKNISADIISASEEKYNKIISDMQAGVQRAQEFVDWTFDLFANAASKNDNIKVNDLNNKKHLLEKVKYKTLSDKDASYITNDLVKNFIQDSLKIDKDSLSRFVKSATHDTSSYDKIYELIAASMVPDKDGLYEQVRKYISSSKINISQGVIKEFGDNWSKVQSTIGINNLSKDGGTEITILFDEMNKKLGTTFDSTKNVQDAFRELFEFLSAKPDLVSNNLNRLKQDGTTQKIKNFLDNAIAEKATPAHANGLAFSPSEIEALKEGKYVGEELVDVEKKVVEQEKEISTHALKVSDSIKSISDATGKLNADTTLSSTSEQLKQEKLDETKQKYQEVAKSSVESANVQKRTLLEVVKEIERVNAENNKLMALEDSSVSNSGMQAFVQRKKQQAQEIKTVQEIIDKIQSKMSEKTYSKTATQTDFVKHAAGIVAYVERFKELAKGTDAFSYDVLGKNGEENFKLMKKAVDEATSATNNNVQKIREFNKELINLEAERFALEQTASSTEKLEVELYSAVKGLEALKTTNKKGDLININSKSFESFFEKWKEYKSSGGTKAISDFTNEAKVINTVNKAYNSYIEQRMKAKEAVNVAAAAEKKRLETQVSQIKAQLQQKFPDADLSKYSAVFDEVLRKKKPVTDAFVEIRDSIQATQDAASKAKTAIDVATKSPQVKAKQNIKLSTNAEINVIPKVEDPVGFVNSVTEQLKGKSVTVDVKLNNVGVATASATIGIESESQQISGLKEKIEGVTAAVNAKTKEFAKEESFVTSSVAKEIKALIALGNELDKIVEKIGKITNTSLKVNVDYSSIKSLYEVGDDGKSSIDKLKSSIDGLQTGVLSDLKNAFQGFTINKDLASRIEEVSNSLKILKESLSGIDPNSTGFLNIIKDLSSQADGLKNLATVIKASKEEIQKAKDEIKVNNTSDVVKDFDISRNSEQWNIIIEKASKYKDVIGDIQKITYSMRQGINGKQLKSYKITGSKSSITLGENLKLIGEKETQTYQKTAEELNKIRNDFISAANQAKISFDISSLKVDQNGVVTFTSTVEKAGQEAVITKYKIEDLYATINNGSLDKTYLDNNVQSLSTKSDKELVDKMASGREKSALRASNEEKKQELAQAKVINEALEQEYNQEQKLIDQMATGRERAALKSQKTDKSAELAQAKAINKAIEDEYKRSQEEQARIEREAQTQRDQFNKSNMNGIDLLIKKREEEARSFSASLKAQMEAEQQLVDKMAAGREKSTLKSQKTDRQQEFAQSKAINESLEQEYRERQKNIEATKKQLELEKQKALTFTRSASKRLSSAISQYSYGDTSVANEMTKQMNRGLSNFGDLSNIQGDITRLSSTVDNIISNLKLSHEQSLSALKEEMKAESKLQSQKDNFYKKNLNSIDYQIKKREEDAKTFSSSLKADMEQRYNGVDYTKVEESLIRTQQLMDKVFNQKQNISGFQSIFDRAKKEIDGLNNKLSTGQIKDIQTGYTDKINKIFQELNKVVGVTNPLAVDQNAIVDAERKMREYANTINNGKVSIGDFNQKTGKMIVSFEKEKGVLQEIELSWNSLTGQISATPSKVKKAQSTLTSFMDGLKARFRSLVQYLTIFVSYYRIIGMIKNGISVVRDLDVALTEMRKVSDETVKSLKDFQDVSFDIAKSVGTTAKQIQNSTADFMRLGESLEQAAESAKVANILLNVSEFESIDEATESLVSMSAAYKELDKIDIVDKLNLIGNNFAISTDGLATALQNSASALKTAQNDIDESIALATAANAVVQDPDKVGAGLRTIALRITGTEAAKDQLTELGEDVDDFVVTTTSKLNKQVMDLTKTAGKDGISLLDDNGNYRSTYEILQDIADVWEQIAKEDLATGQNRQNALLEMLAGKNRSNILASILQSPETLREAYQSSVNDSAGSAQKELEKYLDSIEGKIAQFQNEVQEFWHGLISSETVKGFVDIGTSIIDVLGKITSALGEVGTIAATFGTAFGIHALRKNSGGRDKKFSLVIKYATESFSREVCEFWCTLEC